MVAVGLTVVLPAGPVKFAAWKGNMMIIPLSWALGKSDT